MLDKQFSQETPFEGADSYSHYVELLDSFSDVIQDISWIIEGHAKNPSNDIYLEYRISGLKRSGVSELTEFYKKLQSMQNDQKEETIKILKDCLVWVKINNAIYMEKASKCVFLENSKEKKDFDIFLKNANFVGLMYLKENFRFPFLNEIKSRVNFYEELEKNIKEALEKKSFARMDIDAQVDLISTYFNCLASYPLRVEHSKKRDSKSGVEQKPPRSDDTLLEEETKSLLTQSVKKFNPYTNDASRFLAPFLLKWEDFSISHEYISKAEEAVDFNNRAEKKQDEKIYRNHIKILRENLSFLNNLPNKDEICPYSSLPGGLENLSSKFLQLSYGHNNGKTLQQYLLNATNPLDQTQQTVEDLTKLLQPILDENISALQSVRAELKTFTFTKEELESTQLLSSSNLPSLLQAYEILPFFYISETKFYLDFLQRIKENLLYQFKHSFYTNHTIDSTIGEEMLQKLLSEKRIKDLDRDSFIKRLEDPANHAQIAEELIRIFDSIMDETGEAKLRDFEIFFQECNLEGLERIYQYDPKCYQEIAQRHSNFQQELIANFAKRLEREEFIIKDDESKMTRSTLATNSGEQSQKPNSFKNYVTEGNIQALMKLCKDDPENCRTIAASYNNLRHELKKNLATRFQSDLFRGKNLEARAAFVENTIGGEVIGKLFKTKDGKPDFKAFCKKFETVKDQDGIINSLINAIIDKLVDWKIITPKMRNTSKDRIISNVVDSAGISFSPKNNHNSDKEKKHQKSPAK